MQIFLGYCPFGTRFKVAVGGEEFRNLKLISTKDNACKVSGEKYENGEWKNCEFLMSGDTKINVLPLEHEDEPIKIDIKEEKKEMKKIDYSMPEGEFTIKDFASHNKCCLPTATQKIEKMLEAGAIKKSGVRRTGKKGKPSTLYAKADTA
jgi:hypothetical protein